MSMNTYLKGRLRNTPLPRTHGLLPFYEAVVNSIQALASVNSDSNSGRILIEIIRLPQISLDLDETKSRRGAQPQEPILGFRVVDDGCGFDQKNLESFETLDSDFKADEGCRGVGRLLWLKAFDAVNVVSDFTDSDGSLKRRAFTFTASKGVDRSPLTAVPADGQRSTAVHLDGFKQEYRNRAPKTCRAIDAGQFRFRA